MADIIEDELIEHIASLAMLELKPEEREQAKADLEQMLLYINQLNDLDTSDTEPMTHIFSGSNVFREDVILNGDMSKELLSSAPVERDGCFQVPKTI